MTDTKRLRIAVYHNLGSGGAKRITADELRCLSERHDVTLYSLRSADHAFGGNDAKLPYSVKLYDFTPKPWLGSPFGRWNTVIGVQNVRKMDALNRTIANDIDATRPDVVLVQPCQMTTAPAILKWLRTPSLYFLQELPRRYYEPRIARPYDPLTGSSQRAKMRRAINHFDPLIAYNRRGFVSLDLGAARAATRIITNSEYTRQNGEAAYKRDIGVCYLGVDTTQFGQKNQVGARRARERIVLSVGSLTAAKGFDFVIEAMGTLPAGLDGRRPQLIIISNFQDHAERDYITALAQQHQVPLTCLVNVSEAELHDWYTRASCVAYAPVREPFGLVALEAMASGAPLVAVAEGGVRESVIDGLTGLVAPREPHAFGRAIQTLLADPARAEAQAARAREHVLADWTWAQHIERLNSILAETASARQ